MLQKKWGKEVKWSKKKKEKRQSEKQIKIYNFCIRIEKMME